MIATSNNEWITDVEAMTCRNCVSNIVVVFEAKGDFLIGRIKNMPLGLLKKWASLPNGEAYLKNAVLDAEEVFTEAYSEISDKKPDP